MRLLELDPQWLYIDGRRVGFVFWCPIHPRSKNRKQSVFFEKLTRQQQWDLFETQADSHKFRQVIQGCDEDTAWISSVPLDQAQFETMTITPSLDGSKGGNWHGHITNGEIVGGI